MEKRGDNKRASRQRVPSGPEVCGRGRGRGARGLPGPTWGERLLSASSVPAPSVRVLASELLCSSGPRARLVFSRQKPVKSRARMRSFLSSFPERARDSVIVSRRVRCSCCHEYGHVRIRNPSFLIFPTTQWFILLALPSEGMCLRHPRDPCGGRPVADGNCM